MNTRTDHGARPIHEMTELAHDAAALGVNPMVMRNESGIYAHVDHHGLMTAAEELADFLGERCKPAVETHHHKRGAAGLQLHSILLLKLSQLFAIQRQRLFDERWPTGMQCLGCQGCVGVMTREDEYGIDIGVFQQFRGLFRSLKLEGPLRRSSAPARDGTYGLQAHALDGLQIWKDYARRETAGTYAADPHFIAKARPRCYDSRRAPLRYSGRAVVLQDRCVQAILQIGECFRPILDSVPMLEE